MAKSSTDQWLLISVSTAAAQAATRVFVWRKLRGLGALYIQQSVCLLPNRPPLVRETLRLVDRVTRDGGTARVLHIRADDPGEAAALRAEMNAARDSEYEDLLERLPSFFAELETELARGRASFVEVEESEADLKRFTDWLGKIVARDYFGAALATRAAEQLAAATTALAEFESAALAAEHESAPPAATRRRLTVVDADGSNNAAG